MNQYNRPRRFAPDAIGYGNARNVCPPRYGVNFPTGPRYNCPPPRYGPPQRLPMGYPMPPYHPEVRLESQPPPPVAPYYPQSREMRGDNNGQCFSPASTHTTSNTSTSRSSSPRRLGKGPRTPPGTPPPDVATIKCYSMPPTVDKDNNTKNRNENLWQPRKKHQKPPFKQRFKKQQRNARGRRNSYFPYRDEEGEERPLEPEPPSAINVAVQSYLLQMITSQQPLPNMPYLNSPPPLPPTPTRPPTPPPPPSSSEEENWDTPSEASNDGRDFNENQQMNKGNISPSQRSEEGNLQGPNIQEIEAEPLEFLGAEETVDTSTVNNDINNEILMQNKLEENNEKILSKESNIPFKIKLPSLLKSVEKQKSIETELSIDIPNIEISKSPEKSTNISNQDNNDEDEMVSDKVLTPKIINQENNEDERGTDKSPIEEEPTATDPEKLKRKTKGKKNSNKSNITTWSLELAEKALQIEQDIQKDCCYKENVLLLRFPDPPLSRELVKDFHKDIESVHFQNNAGPRYCFVNLKEESNVNEAIESISKIPFGCGTIKAELRKNLMVKTSSIKPENIDPFTLYVGNLPLAIPCKVLKQHFHGANRINIGFAQRRKNTRYAFIQYHKMEDAIDAFRRMAKFEIDGRTLVIRFKRLGSAAQQEEDADHHHVDMVENNVTNISNISPEFIEDNRRKSPQENKAIEKNISPKTNSNLNSNGNKGIETIMEEEIHTSNTPGHRFDNSAGSLENVEKDIGISNSNISPKSNGSLTSTSEIPEENAGNTLECLTFDSETQTDNVSNALAETENTGSNGTTNNCQSNTLESLAREGVQEKETNTDMLPLIKNIKTEESENNEKVLYTMPRLNNLPNFINKTEMDEDFEFFSNRANRSSVCTERSNSALSGITSIDTYTSDKSQTNQSYEKNVNQNMENEIDEDLIEDINEDINLLKESLNNKRNIENPKRKDKNRITQNKLPKSPEGNSDLVPANALLMRRNSRLVSNDTTSSRSLFNDQLQMKKEILPNDNSLNIGKKSEYSQTTNSCIGSRKRKAPFPEDSSIDIKSKALNSTINQDDDLVPSDCALNLYKKSVNIYDLTLDDDPILQIKREAETEDLFSLPKRSDKGKRKEKEINKNKNFDKISKGSKNSINMEISKIQEKSNAPKSISNVEEYNNTVNDDDVIIVSCNITPNRLPLRQDLCFSTDKDLLQIKEENNNTASNIEKTFFEKYKRPTEQRDNLDRLFALLETNSDDEL